MWWRKHERSPCPAQGEGGPRVSGGRERPAGEDLELLPVALEEVHGARPHAPSPDPASRGHPLPERERGKAFALPLAAALVLTLSACFTPLYGPTASGERLDSVLAAIEIDKVASPPAFERLTHYLRSELVFDLNGSGQPAPARYRLALAYDQQVTAPIIDATTGRAQSASVIGEVTYTLKDLDGRTVTEGKAVSSASYDRSQQRFATVRAARDADIRLAKVLSEQIKLRLASALKTGI